MRAFGALGGHNRAASYDEESAHVVAFRALKWKGTAGVRHKQSAEAEGYGSYVGRQEGAGQQRGRGEIHQFIEELLNVLGL